MSKNNTDAFEKEFDAFIKEYEPETTKVRYEGDERTDDFDEFIKEYEKEDLMAQLMEGGEAGLRGLAKGLTMGQWPKVEAAGKAVLDDAPESKGISDDFEYFLNQVNNRTGKLERDYPTASGLGEMAGLYVGPGKFIKGPMAALKGAGLGAGHAYGTGGDEADVAIGALTGGLGGALTKTATNIGGAIERGAEKGTDLVNKMTDTFYSKIGEGIEQGPFIGPLATAASSKLDAMGMNGRRMLGRMGALSGEAVVPFSATGMAGAEVAARAGLKGGKYAGKGITKSAGIAGSAGMFGGSSDTEYDPDFTNWLVGPDKSKKLEGVKPDDVIDEHSISASASKLLSNKHPRQVLNLVASFDPQGAQILAKQASRGEDYWESAISNYFADPDKRKLLHNTIKR